MKEKILQFEKTIYIHEEQLHELKRKHKPHHHVTKKKQEFE